MSDDLITGKEERGLRFIYGRPEVVEAEVNRLGDTYACTNLYFYVCGDHLEVNATLLHTREIRKAQLMQMQPAGGLRRQ